MKNLKKKVSPRIRIIIQEIISQTHPLIPNAARLYAFQYNPIRVI